MIRYSDRLNWSAVENPVAQHAQALRSRGAALLDLTVSNPTQVFPNYPHAAITAAVSQVEDWSYDPNPLGVSSARHAVASFYDTKGLSTTADRIVLTASSSESYSVLFKLFCDAGNSVLVPSPSYPLFEYLAALEEVRFIPYRLAFDGAWHIDLDDLKAKINDRTRAIVVVAPNNPTGSFLHTTETRALSAIATEHGLPIISDEVFMDYPLEPAKGRTRSWIEHSDVLSFSLNGLSKAAAMPQMKLGWIVMNGPTHLVSVARARLELVLDTYLSVGTAVQRALPQLLSIGASLRDDIQRRILRNLQALHHLLGDSGAHCLFAEAGWSCIIQLPRLLEEPEWVRRLLLEKSVIVQPGYFFDMPSEPFVIVSLITEPGILDEGARRLTDLVREVTRG